MNVGSYTVAQKRIQIKYYNKRIRKQGSEKNKNQMIFVRRMTMYQHITKSVAITVDYEGGYVASAKVGEKELIGGKKPFKTIALRIFCDNIVDYRFVSIERAHKFAGKRDIFFVKFFFVKKGEVHKTNYLHFLFTAS